MYLYISSPSPSSSILSLCSIITIIICCCCPLLAQATVGDKCNFDKYGSAGCYSRANIQCDLSINECVCMPETPVLIDRKLCVKRSKENETCQYNEQCDNEQGFYCSYSDHKLLNNCLPVTLFKEYNLKESFGPPRCKCIKINAKQLAAQNFHKIHSPQQQQQQQSQQQQHQQQQTKPSRSSHQHQNQNSLPNGSSYLPRLVWISLLICLVGLILLLLMIKSDFYRLRHHRSTRQEDRISINSEADVPPPYEVAIRMKL